MKRLGLALILLITIETLLPRCANVGTPTGGPKDTIPPVLLESDPKNGKTNYKGQEFRFEFSEYISAEKLKQQLIITPKTDITYKSVTKRNQLILKFNEPFEDSTTYNFNFADGVTDITEKNPVVNLSLAFSTGNYIDSMRVQGSVIDLFSQEPAEGYTVGLYPYTDTLDYFKHNPLYFTTTNEEGTFELPYIKSANYKLLAFNDDNRNILLDPETEAHGFIKGQINLDSALILEKPIATILQNVKPIAFINSRPTGPYIEFKYNKAIGTYSILPDTYASSLTGDNKEVIRIYKQDQTVVGDSLQFILTASDSLSNTTVDTIKTAFVESNRKPSSFSFSANTNQFLKDDQLVKFKFNKPIKEIDTSKLLFSRDSTLTYPITSSKQWNSNRTELTLTTNLNKDSLIEAIKQSIPKDTTTTDSSGTATNKKTTFDASNMKVDFKIEKGAFLSIENDTSEVKSISLPLEESTSFGTVKFSITTDVESFNLQLVDTKGNVKHENWNKKEVSFAKVKPDNYTIRVLIDSDKDGTWTQGNLLKDVPPEDIYLHPEETSVRENWVLEIDLTF